MSASHDTAQIEGRVRDLLAAVLALPAESIRPESRIILDLNAESLDVLDLRFRIEEEFAVRIEPEQLARAFGPDVTKELFEERFTLHSLSEYVRLRLAE